MKTTGGVTDGGIVAGNVYDKYGSRHPIVRRLMHGYAMALGDLVDKAAPRSIHEIGCGEGYWTIHWHELGLDVRGCDFSGVALQLARENAARSGMSPARFRQRSIYDLDTTEDSADLVVCCEVLEHLDDPEAGLRALQRVVSDHLIVSVPNEPLWRMMNLARGKYVSDLGNTPGHLQHWSKAGFVELVSRYFAVIDIRRPIPWTMLLCRARQPS